ncbi:MAG TPA: RNA polymerase sigma factor [Ktedonobacterales bacterium]|nr:RNA polymerase sigma factor [Ktedonobacterales bacterium]
MRILYRHALDVLEGQHASSHPLSLDEARVPEGSVVMEDQMDQADLQEEVVQREDIWQALAHLSAEQRRVIALRYGADLTEVDIAHVLGWPVGTVKSRLHRAREQLRLLLSEEER